MPLYRFRVYDGRHDADVTEVELPNAQAARAEALRFAGDSIRDAAKYPVFSEEWRAEVTDGTGLLLFRMDFVLAEAPVVRMRPSGQA